MRESHPQGCDLVLCADEFGCSRGACEAILDLLDMQRLSAVAVCPNGPAWRDFGPVLARRHGEVGIGLLLTGAGARAGREAREREIALQIASFCEVTGFTPDFIGSRNEWHSRPWYRRALFHTLERLAGRGMEMRGLWLRDPTESVATILRRGRGKWPAMAASTMARGFAGMAQGRGYAVNRGYAGFVQQPRDYPVSHDVERYCQYPGKAPLVICRPAYDEDELAGLDPQRAHLADRRVRETMYLSSTRFTDLLELLGIRLVPRPASSAFTARPRPEAGL